MKHFWKVLSITAGLASLIAGLGAEIAKHHLRAHSDVEMTEDKSGEVFFFEEDDGPTGVFVVNDAADERRIDFSLNCAIISLFSAVFYLRCSKKEETV